MSVFSFSRPSSHRTVPERWVDLIVFTIISVEWFHVCLFKSSTKVVYKTLDNPTCVCPVLLCPWQVRGGLSSEVLQQPAWHPFWPQIHHISIWSAQVNIHPPHPSPHAVPTEQQGLSLTIVFLLCGRFVQYKATSLEKQHKHELLTEPDLGVTIDLINPDTYRIDPNSKSAVTWHIVFCIFLKRLSL